MQNTLQSEIQFLKGVGPKRASLLEKELGIKTVDDLIHFFPFRHIDRSSVVAIADIVPDSATIQIMAEVVSQNLQPKKLSVIVRDSSGEMELVFFKGIKYTASRLVPGSRFIFFGKPVSFNGRINMVHPEIDPVQAEGSPQKGVMTGVYPSTERLRSAGFIVVSGARRRYCGCNCQSYETSFSHQCKFTLFSRILQLSL